MLSENLYQSEPGTADKRIKVEQCITSVKILNIASRILILGRLPSGSGSSQFFNNVKTP